MGKGGESCCTRHAAQLQEMLVPIIAVIIMGGLMGGLLGAMFGAYNA